MHFAHRLGAIFLLASSSLGIPIAAQTPSDPPDWPQLGRYRAENATLPAPAPGVKRVVFYGDSITDGWGRQPDTGSFFPGKPYVNRGISGPTTPQMLVRFQQDVVHLQPAAVVILAGTNDVAGNTGPSSPAMIEDNFRSMAAIAQQNGIKVVLASITPAYNYPWKPTIEPVATIREVNTWLKAFCDTQHLVYLDYYTAMTDEKGAMKPGLAKDGVHPTAAGYAIMEPLAETPLRRLSQDSRTPTGVADKRGVRARGKYETIILRDPVPYPKPDPKPLPFHNRRSLL